MLPIFFVRSYTSYHVVACFHQHHLDGNVVWACNVFNPCVSTEMRICCILVNGVRVEGHVQIIRGQ